MTEHYFPLKLPIYTNTTTTFSPEKQSRVGRLQQRDVTAAPRAHTFDVTFYKFQFQSTFYEW